MIETVFQFLVFKMTVEYTVELLKEKTNELLGQREYKTALQFANRLHSQTPSDTSIMELIGSIHIELEQAEDAKFVSQQD